MIMVRTGSRVGKSFSRRRSSGRLDREEQFELSRRAWREVEAIVELAGGADALPAIGDGGWRWTTRAALLQRVELARAVMVADEAAGVGVGLGAQATVHYERARSLWWELAMSAQWMVPGEASRFARWWPAEDLESEARIALFVAAQRFEAERGVVFEIYAGRWVRAELRRWIEDHGREVRLPSSATRRRLQVAQIRAARGEVSTDEIADELGVGRAYLVDVLAAGETPLSMDAPLAHPGGVGTGSREERAGWTGMVYGGTLAAQGPDLDEGMDHAVRERAVDREMARLPARVRDVVQRRLAGESLAEIGRDLGISRERARQLQEQGVARLRAAAGVRA